MKHLAWLTERIGEFGTEEQIRDLFSEVISDLGYGGFDAYAMWSATISNPDQPCNFFLCDYGLKLPRDYVFSNWLQMDPVIAELARRSAPFEYLEFLRNAQPNSSVRWQQAALRLAGVKRAWVVPLNIVGCMRGATIYMADKQANSEEHFHNTRNEIHLMSACLMEAVSGLRGSSVNGKLAGERLPSSQATFTTREIDCLHWMARGKTNKEIGMILSISDNTVRYHVKNSFRKLGTRTRSSAVSKALLEKVIEI